MENNESVLTPEEELKLKTTYDFRNKLFNIIYKDGAIPNSPRELEVANEILNSMDKQTLDKVNIRLKSKENTTKENTIDMVVEMMKTIQTNKSSYINVDKKLDLNKEDIPNDISPKEIVNVPDNIKIHDIIKD